MKRVATTMLSFFGCNRNKMLILLFAEISYIDCERMYLN